MARGRNYTNWVIVIGGEVWVQEDIMRQATAKGYNAVGMTCAMVLSDLKAVRRAVRIYVADETDAGVECLEELWISKYTNHNSYGVLVNPTTTFSSLPHILLAGVTSNLP